MTGKDDAFPVNLAVLDESQSVDNQFISIIDSRGVG
jgi:hypothetical protein